MLNWDIKFGIVFGMKRQKIIRDGLFDKKNEKVFQNLILFGKRQKMC